MTLKNTTIENSDFKKANNIYVTLEDKICKQQNNMKFVISHRWVNST